MFRANWYVWWKDCGGYSRTTSVVWVGRSVDIGFISIIIAVIVSIKIDVIQG